MSEVINCPDWMASLAFAKFIKGKSGDKGDAGKGIQSITETDGGDWKITYTDGSSEVVTNSAVTALSQAIADEARRAMAAEQALEEGKQPKGDYPTRSELPTKLEQLSSDELHQTVTAAEKLRWESKQPAGDYALAREVPTRVGQLENDSKFITQAEGDLRYQKLEEGKGLSANDYSNEEKTKVANSLQKTVQSYTAEEKKQLQENMGVKDTVDVVGVGEIRDVPQEIAQDGKYYDTNGVIQSNVGYFISQPFAVKRGDIIIGSVTAASYVSIISKVDNGIFKKVLCAPGKTGSNNVIYMVMEDSDVVFSGGKYGFRLKYIPCNLASIIGQPAGGYNRQLYEAAGAVYNETSGFYELNGLIDITESEMAVIYAVGFLIPTAEMRGKYAGFSVKTFLANTKQTYASQNKEIDLSNTFRDNLILKKLVFPTTMATPSLLPYIKDFTTTFYNNKNLEEVVGFFNMERITAISVFTFRLCPKLETIKLYKLKCNISFQECPLLTVEDSADSTLGYIVENAANDSPITITLHPDAFARVPETLIQKATQKNISIASV